MATNRKFVDFNVAFEPHPITGDIIKVTDEQAIKQSLKNLIFTNFYEAPFQPLKGSGLRNMLFEPTTQFTADRIKNAITDLIDKYEPRVNIVSLQILVRDEQSYHVMMTYGIVNTIEPITLNFLLQRIR